MKFSYLGIFLILLSLIFCSSAQQSVEDSSRLGESPYEVQAKQSSPKPYMPASPPAVGGVEITNERQIKRMMVYNVTVNLQSKNIEPKVTEIIQLAESFGGYSLQYSSNGTLQLKVPSEKLKPFLLNLKKNSENYTEEVSAKDVTEEYLDTEIRLDNASKMRIRLLEILKTAKTVEETLKVESELNKVSENIERLEGRIKYLSSVVAFSSITVYVRKKWEPNIQKEYQPGPLGIPFYYGYLGLVKLKNGIVWLFVQEIPNKPKEESY